MPFKDPKLKKLKQKQYAKTYYEKNKRSVIIQSAIAGRASKARWIRYKARQKCSHCGAKHPAIIDFHHVVRDKDKVSVNYLVQRKRSFKRVMEEIDKCIPLCANCHRILHWKEKVAKKRRTTIRRRRLKAKKKATG